MTYTTAAIESANPGVVLYTALEGALTTAGFTFVETVTISTRTHKVWKSPAASNLANLDWYLDVQYPTTGAAGVFKMQVFEYYDPATHLGYRGLYSGASSTTIETTYHSRYGATGYALETNWLGNANFSSYGLALTINPGYYYMSVTTNRVILMSSWDDTYIFYVGLYEPDPLYAAKAGVKTYPLVGIKFRAFYNGIWQDANTVQADVTGALTRLPPATTLTGSGWGSHLMSCWSVAGMPSNTIPGASTVMYPFVASRARLLCNASVQVSYGYLYDLAAMASTAAQGDTVTISGATWMLAQSINGYSPLFKVV